MSDGNAHGGFASSNLRSGPPTYGNWNDVAMTTDIPLQATQARFASNQPSVMPSPDYAYASPVQSSHSAYPPPVPLHSSMPPASGGISSEANEHSQFAQNNAYDLRTVHHPEQGGASYDMYKRNSERYNGKGTQRSDGFIPLETNQDGLPHQGISNGSAYPPGDAHQPYQRQFATAPFGERNIIRQILFGPMQRPWFSWLSGLAMAIVVIVEFVKNHQLTGNVIATSPFNPMIGPSFTVLVNLGARYTPCIRPLPLFTPTTTVNDCYRSLQDTCTLEELCGFGGFDGGEPNQSFRFVTPIFMHAGIVHFLINMMTHLRLGADLECLLGIPRYLLLYLGSGIWGFVLSATLSQTNTASMGCSGALFGLIGYMFVDIVINWKTMQRPGVELTKLLIVTIVSLVLGLLPGLDNFAHIGGFAVGIVMGALIAPMRDNSTKKTKMVTLGIRLVALVLIIIMFAVTINSFYKAVNPAEICPKCKYLSCLPVNGWCDM